MCFHFHAPDHIGLSLPFPSLYLWKKFLINVQLSVNATFQKKLSPIPPPELIILNYQCTSLLSPMNNFFHLLFIHSSPKGLQPHSFMSASPTISNWIHRREKRKRGSEQRRDGSEMSPMGDKIGQMLGRAQRGCLAGQSCCVTNILGVMH